MSQHYKIEGKKVKILNKSQIRFLKGGSDNNSNPNNSNIIITDVGAI